MREQISLNDKWEFAEEFSDAFLKAGEISGAVEVRIPHTVKELPYHYFDDAMYQMLSGYRRIIHAEESWKGKRIFEESSNPHTHSRGRYMHDPRSASCRMDRVSWAAFNK